MTQEEMIKSTKEWKALNLIWKRCSSEQRVMLRSEFEIVSKFIKENVCTTGKVAPKDGYGYLNALSIEAKQFIILKVNSGERNIYHSIMSVLDNKPDLTKNEVKKYYFERFSRSRPYLEENRELVCEILNLCWDRMHGINR